MVARAQVAGPVDFSGSCWRASRGPIDRRSSRRRLSPSGRLGYLGGAWYFILTGRSSRFSQCAETSAWTVRASAKSLARSFHWGASAASALTIIIARGWVGCRRTISPRRSRPALPSRRRTC
eukprot:480430-Pyramimonas_sp.AAC.1